MSKDLSGLFLGGDTGRGVQPLMSGVITAWDAVTHYSTVNVGGAVIYTNLPLLESALATMAVGKLALLRMTDRGPMIYGTLVVPV